MNKSLRWKSALLLFMIIISGIIMLPSFTDNVPGWWKKYLAPNALRLGLDLQGGMHLVLKVDLGKAIENNLDLAAQNLKDGLAGQGISVVRTASADPKKVVYTIPNTGSLDQVKEILKKDFPNLTADIQSETGSFPRLTLALSSDQVNSINQNAVNQALEIIRNRIDQFGVAEPVIVRQGDDEIVVQLPGVKDAKRAMDLIGKTAQLEFKLLYEEGDVDLNSLITQASQSGAWQDGNYQGDGRRQLNRALQGRLPANTEIYFEKRADPQTKKETVTPLLIKTPIMMTGAMIQDAKPQIGGSFNEPYVSMELTTIGGKLFGDITEKNVNKRFAIILDDIVRSAPVIRERILGGSAQISGNFTYEEASDLAIVLRVGALPAPVKIVQNLTVGATLGQDSIDKSITAGLIGTVMVIIFMLFYYRLSGLIANGGMILNVIFLIAGLAAFSATLTLPGIAGIILSIGMAVDSNILIFERMREEFALGKTVRSGIEAGYEKALPTVVDAHVTTLVTAFALFLFGTGPIKGFAVSLSLGIIFNLVSTLFGTKLVYDIIHVKGGIKKLDFLHIIGHTNFDFMSWRKICLTGTAVVMLLGVIGSIQIGRGKANMGIDFSGGVLLQYKAGADFSIDEVRSALGAEGLGDAELQNVVNERRLIVKIKKVAEETGDLTATVDRALQQHLSSKNFELESQSEIGSSVSSALRSKALLAIVLSMVGVIIYLAFRFNFSFGVAAAAATFHDVLAVLAVCWIFHVEITLLIVTALLTLAGFSLNDTVVIFDRIREKRAQTAAGKIKNHGFVALINDSINEVLSRTIITVLTVVFTLVALFFWGGAVIHDFAFALLFGVVFGTYSSIFVASPILLLMNKDESGKA
ncbi:MAG: protein translocase subunit SecD [Desulfobulbaceae bacterium]|nr:protein translocase subunit SecD [Desulfobulbaceae bacterium]